MDNFSLPGRHQWGLVSAVCQTRHKGWACLLSFVLPSELSYYSHITEEKTETQQLSEGLGSGDLNDSLADSG